MFNQVTPAEVVAAVGRTTMDAARSSRTDDSFAKGQLMSASSTCRHLSVELSAYPAILRAFRGDVAAALDGVFVAGSAESALVARLTAADDFVSVGDIVGDLLDALRREGNDVTAAARARVRRLLAQLTVAEVDALAQTIEPHRPGVENATRKTFA